MKKLLSLLTIPVIATSIPAPLLANTLQTRVKRDVSTLTSNSNNDYLPPTKIDMSYFGDVDDVSSITIDSNNNVYFGADKGAFVLKQGSTTPNKINGIFPWINSIAIDSNNNVYFGTYKGVFVLKNGEVNAKKIDKINDNIKSIFIDKQDNVYFGVRNGAYKLSAGSNTKTKINGISEHVSSITIDSNNNVYFGADKGAFVLKQGSTKLTNKINGINSRVYSVAIDSNNNVYFGTYEGTFVLNQGTTTPTKIKDISEHVSSIAIDSNNNIYFGSDYGAFVLKQGSTTPNKINGIFPWINSIAIDSNNNVYFGTYEDEGVFVLKQGSTTATPIKGSSKHVLSIAIDSNNNIYFGGDNRFNYITTILDWTKTQSQFNIDSTKTMTWTRPDLIMVDGELNIDIANSNIDKVVFDNVLQPQTAKKWTINVKPELASRDHNLQVLFTLDGKQYTSEIIVSMQAKIDPPSPSVKENLSDVIKFDDNNLGNILDNNDETIISAISQKNSRQIDFSQITIDKIDNEATLTAKKDSKSYQGSVVVKYNVVPATVVDLKINLKPTAQTIQVVKDYVGQIDKSNITNPVNTFYYANSESKITMLKPTASSVLTGVVVYGCNERWNKTSQHNQIDPTNGIVLDGSQLATTNGKYVVELSDNLGHTNNIYLQIAKKQAVEHYFDTPNGKQFEIWAEDNGYKNIRGYSASQLNNLFALSATWKQSLKHLDLKLDNFVVDNIKNVTQDEIDNYKTKLLNTVKSQVEKYVPDVVENTDYVINTNNLVAGDWTTSKDVTVQAVNSSTKLLNFTTATIPVQQKYHPETLVPTSEPTPDNKDEDSKLWIIGVVVGVLGLGGIVYLLFRKFIFNKYILPKIYARRQQKVVEQWKRDDREEAEELARKQAEREEKQNNKNDDNKGGDE